MSLRYAARMGNESRRPFHITRGTTSLEKERRVGRLTFLTKLQRLPSGSKAAKQQLHHGECVCYYQPASNGPAAAILLSSDPIMKRVKKLR